MMALLRYLTQYRFRDMGELIRNGKGEPLPCDINLTDKTVVISGSTSGIGLETARLFAEKGAELVCINRSREKSDALEKELRDRFNCRIRTIIADFSSLRDVKKAAEKLAGIEKPIDVLIHNSGVFNTRRRLTDDGIEEVFQVNHLGSFLINRHLMDRLKSDNRCRIIYVSSEGHRFAIAGVHLGDLHWRRHLYTGLKSYGAAKTAQLLTMGHFREYFSDSKVTINAMHPGNVVSSMGENNGGLYRWMKKKLILSSAKDPSISARALHYLVAAEELEGISGEFFNLTTPEKPAPHARDTRQIVPVWEKSMELCGL